MKTNKPGAYLLFIIFACVLTAHGALLQSPLENEVTLADDAFHYPAWADRRHDGNYIEWWYFNVFDETQDVQAIFTYFVADPDNRLRQGLAQLAAVVYTPDGIVSEIDLFPPGAFSASTEQADVQIRENSIQVVDRFRYRVTGESRNGRLSWDLTYTREAQPWAAADRIPVGKFRWELMSWLVYMPRAEVQGQIVVDGRVLDIMAPGYHDHNWGEWIFPNALWNWAQFSLPGLSIELGDFVGKPVGVLGVEVEGARTVFTPGQYELTHSQWEYDPINRVSYPVESTVRAEDSTRRLVFTMRAIDTHPLRGDLPLPLPDPIIYEQTAWYEGELLERNEHGEWILSRSFSGYGFKEYTGKHF